MADGAAVQGEPRFTYAGYKAWNFKEGKRYKLPEGTPRAMAAPSDRHQPLPVPPEPVFAE
jgi:hypothetical protein